MARTTPTDGMSLYQRSDDEGACSDSDVSTGSGDSSCLSQASWSFSASELSLTGNTGRSLPPPLPVSESRTPPRTPLRAVANEEAYQISLQRLRQTVAARVTASGDRKRTLAAMRFGTPQALTATPSSPCSPEDGATQDLFRLSLQSLAGTEGGAEEWLTGPTPTPQQPSDLSAADDTVKYGQPAAAGDAADTATERVAELESQVAQLERQQSDWERLFVEDVEVEVARRLELGR